MWLWCTSLLLLTYCYGLAFIDTGSGIGYDKKQSQILSQKTDTHEDLKQDNSILQHSVATEVSKPSLTFGSLSENDFTEVGENENVDVEYTAAVLEYSAYSDLANGGLAVLRENARIFIEYAALAKEEGADIIIFPEYGLTSTRLGGDLDSFLPQTQIVPNVEDAIIPCYYSDVSSYTQVMQELSCGAAELGIYLVVDLAEQVECSQTEDSVFANITNINNLQDTTGKADGCPDTGYIFYNSQVVFDRAGTVIARYRKKHLFLEPHFTKGDQPDEEATFVTDFGVTFTLQVCFDIMYQAPALHNIENLGIRDVAMSTAWIDELPFLTASQIWKGWSEGLKVNLLAANYHNPQNGELGSGIFRGVSSEPETYTYDANGPDTTLVVGKVKTKSSTANSTRVVTDTRELVDVDTLRHLGTLETLEAGILENPVKSKHSVNTSKPSNLQSEGHDNLSTSTVGLLPIQEKKRKTLKDNKIGENQSFIHEDLTSYHSSTLERTESDFVINKTLCHDEGLCCTLSYTYSFNETEEGFYKLFAYSGVVEKGGGVYAMYTQTCAVVFCLTNDTDSCARIEGREPTGSALRAHDLKGTFASPHVYPSVFTQYLELQDSSVCTFSIDQQSKYYYGSLNCTEKVDNILSMTMFSRWYPMDPKKD